MNSIITEFRSPGNAYRGKPFWSWNGELKEEELLRQIAVMQEMGLGGFFMHSRTGLITEYLGDEWFRLTNSCADEAERRGMEAWLYDEDRWPSGTAGGMVTQNPEYRSRYMSLRTLPGGEFAWHDGISAAFACHLEGVSFTDCQRLTSASPREAYLSKTVLVFTVEEMDPSSFYNGYTYADTLSREATERFIEITHEQYKDRCGSRLGKSIRGIFTDEPHRGSVFSGFGCSNENRHAMTPWTDALPARFLEQFGYDIVDHLPELFLQAGGAAVAPIKWQYMELLQQMFLANYAKPLYDWCSANDMLLTGHALHEDSLTAQVAMQGSLMRFYEYMHCPGIDLLAEGNRHYPIVKQLTSAARQLGRTWLLSELYGCTGWQMDFEDHKQVGDWQALLGINLRCHHLSWYTMEGEAKRDYPASILHQSAWWKQYDYVESYFARLGLVLMQGQPCCDILLLNPIESLWCQIGVGWAEGLSPKTDPIRELEKGYAELTEWLFKAHLDFDYGDEEMIARLSRVSSHDAGQPVLCIGNAEYRVVVVGRHTTLRQSTMRLLKSFRDAGGAVIFVGTPPAYVDAVLDSAPADLAANCMQVLWDRHQLAAACRNYIQHDVEILDCANGDQIAEIACQLRMDGDNKYLVALNRNEAAGFEHVTVRIQGQGHVAEWDCRSGERHAVPATQHGGYVEFTTDFAPSGERVFVVSAEADTSLEQRPIQTMSRETPVAGPFAYRLGEENVCVLDIARFQIGDGPWREKLEILKVDSAVRDALGVARRGGSMVQPWFHHKYEPETPELATVRLAFEFTVEMLPKGPVHVCLERPESWRLTLNHQPILSRPEGWWVDIAFRKIPLPGGLLQLGANELILETEFRASANIEAVYLIGDFGVRAEDSHCTITSLPEHLLVGDVIPQGLPFYGGAVYYKCPIDQFHTSKQLRVAAQNFSAAYVRIHAGSEAPQMIAWQPFRADIKRPAEDFIEIEAMLTRRNTFGPLHQIPLRAGSYGPDNFITKGEAFSEAHMLYPAGLLEAPIISCVE